MKIGTLVRLSNANEANEKFAHLAELGFNACQLVFKPAVFLEEDAKIIKDAAEANGIEISAQFCGYRDGGGTWNTYDAYLTNGVNVEAYRMERIAYLREGFKFAKMLDLQDVVIHAGFVENNPFSASYVNMVGTITVLANFAAKLGLNILFETGMECPMVLRRLIEDVGTGNLYINFDPANIFMYGYGNAMDALEVFGQYVRNFHVKDGLLPTDIRLLGKEVPIGEGKVDFPYIFKKFKELGYDRYAIIEREISGPQQEIDILKAKDYILKLIEQNA